MEYGILGHTGVTVSNRCLGAMMFGPWGDPDHDNGIRTIRRALDAGINFIDTADVYSRGESEEIVAKAIAGRREDIILATNFHGGAMGEDPNQQGSSRRWIIRAVENGAHDVDTNPKLLTIEEVADYLRVPVLTVRWLRQDGRFAPAIKVGRRLGWDARDVMAGVESRRESTESG